MFESFGHRNAVCLNKTDRFCFCLFKNMVTCCKSFLVFFAAYPNNSLGPPFDELRRAAHDAVS